ncbi:unnamed protein product [Symbiodinium microadriaticum]|nr:unnamed protein product [Symbiodinium microadriaticum]
MMRGGCPEISSDLCLLLIREIEAARGDAMLRSVRSGVLDTSADWLVLEGWEFLGGLMEWVNANYAQVPENLRARLVPNRPMSPGDSGLNRHSRRRLQRGGAMVHLFAGSQRWEHPNGNPSVSLDISRGFDIVDDALFHYLLELGRAGAIEALIGALPSDTFWFGGADDRKRLRDGSSLGRFGAPTLTDEERFNVDQDTVRILRFMILADVSVMGLKHRHGDRTDSRKVDDVLLVLEHPEEVTGSKDEVKAPSLWSWPEVESFKTRWELHKASFHQGMLGDYRVRPSSILTSSSYLWERLHLLKIPHSLLEGAQNRGGEGMKAVNARPVHSEWPRGLVSCIREALHDWSKGWEHIVRSSEFRVKRLAHLLANSGMPMGEADGTAEDDGGGVGSVQDNEWETPEVDDPAFVLSESDKGRIKSENDKWRVIAEGCTEVAHEVIDIPMVEILPTKSAKAIVSALNKFYARLRSWGLPVYRMHSDRARELTDPLVTQWAAHRGIYKTTTAPEQPAGNGRAENKLRRVATPPLQCRAIAVRLCQLGFPVPSPDSASLALLHVAEEAPGSWCEVSSLEALEPIEPSFTFPVEGEEFGAEEQVQEHALKPEARIILEGRRLASISAMREQEQALVKELQSGHVELAQSTAELLEQMDNSVSCLESLLESLSGQAVSEWESEGLLRSDVHLRALDAEADVLQTKMVPIAEVAKDIDSWKPSLSDELASVTTVHKAGVIISEEEARLLESNPDVEVLRVPGKTRKERIVLVRVPRVMVLAGLVPPGSWMRVEGVYVDDLLVMTQSEHLMPTLVIRYLMFTVDYCLCYGPSLVVPEDFLAELPSVRNDAVLETWADASFAAQEDGDSQTGVIVTLVGMPVAWLSLRQPCVALSTCEAEVVSCIEGVCLTRALRPLIEEMLGQVVTWHLLNDSVSCSAVLAFPGIVLPGGCKCSETSLMKCCVKLRQMSFRFLTTERFGATMTTVKTTDARWTSLSLSRGSSRSQTV